LEKRKISLNLLNFHRKIFIKHPKTLFDIEAKRVEALHRIVTKIQSCWRAWRVRKVYLALKKQAMDIFKGQKERTRHSVARGVGNLHNTQVHIISFFLWRFYGFQRQC
jgi:myosin heavy subunit